MKKVLLISYNFAPRHTVGAIRPTKLASYLAKDGYIVDVVTVKPYGELDHSMDSCINDVNKFYYLNTVIVDDRSYTKSSNQNTQKSTEKTLIRRIKDLKCLSGLKTYLYEKKRVNKSVLVCKEFKKLIGEQPKVFSEYDVCISTYGPVASHLCGLAFKKAFPNVKWIADFRDPMVVHTTTKSTYKFRAKVQKDVCERADKLVAVSNGYYDMIFGDKYKGKASVIYNGFDKNDMANLDVKSDGRFSFAYVGAMYAGKRDISPIFTALNELIDNGKIKAEDVDIVYAGSSFSVLENQAESTGFKGNLINRGTVFRDESLAIQLSSRHLLLSTWNEEGEGGVFPGKFLEYIMTGRPIISLVSGNVPNSEVTVVMKKAGLGITYEDATRARDLANLKEYLLNDYALYKEGKQPASVPKAEEVAKFDFANTARSFEELF